MDQFTSRAHHSIFLFVAEERTPQRWCVRGFRLTRSLQLQEETDVALVTSAWSEFRRSEIVSCSADAVAELVGLHPFSDPQLANDQKTLVSVPTWSTLAHYATTLSGSDLDDALDSCLTNVLMPWRKQGVSCAGRLVHRSSCNIFSGCADVPLLVPRAEIFGADPRETKRARSLLEKVMPEGWFRRNLIGARIHCIEIYR